MQTRFDKACKKRFCGVTEQRDEVAPGRFYYWVMIRVGGYTKTPRAMF